jgi:predicted 3-demethylubiquinone-9 3-methyltransferase (glyoxalase superfamily)
MNGMNSCLWFENEGEEAATFYTSIFPNSEITGVSRYGEAGPGEPGTAMTVEFELDGATFVALNGGQNPNARFTQGISFQVFCENQHEVDHLWTKLTEDGGEEGPCAWLKDRYGVSWQIVPSRLPELLNDPDRDKAQRVMAAMLKMKKIEIAELEEAAAAG